MYQLLVNTCSHPATTSFMLTRHKSHHEPLSILYTELPESISTHPKSRTMLKMPASPPTYHYSHHHLRYQT
jgi:hypothetical protein